MKKERENRTVGWCGSGDGGEKLFDLVVLEKSLVLLGLLRWRPRPLTAVLVLAAALVHPVEESGIAAAPLVAAVGGVAAVVVGAVVEALIEIRLGLVLQITDEAPAGLIQCGGDQSRIHRQSAQVQTQTERVAALLVATLLALTGYT
jgi:hypothetical protein